MNYIRKLLSLLTKKERKQLGLLTLAMMIMAFMEVVGVGAIGPFMAVAADPSVVERTPVLLWLYNLLGINDIRYFVAVLGIIFFLVILGTNGFTTVVMYYLYRWSDMRAYTLGRRLFSQYLYQPYSYFLDHNTSELSKNILSEVQQVLRQAIRPGIELMTRGMVAAAILLFLVISSPLVALIVTVILGGTYALVFGLVRNRLTKIGTRIRQLNRERFKVSGESFGAIKDVKILGKEPVFEDKFARASKKFAWQHARRQIITGLPHYVIEAVAMGMVVLLVVAMILRGGDFAEVIPIISVYAFAGYRLMPALRVLFKNSGALRSSGPVVQSMYDDLTIGADAVAASRSRALNLNKNIERIPFITYIRLKNIQFSYPTSPEPVLNDINITIKKNSTIGFIGPTGCGKTTLVDIILGLLLSDGVLEADGTSITENNVRNWQLNFGYVPQQIFLADDTVTQNIAFGVHAADIDQKAVERAARIAHLDEFIRNEMPQGYETMVGERGIRLSGGQRQRIGIARALYHDPDILVLDEATSALDNVTEQAVMDAINDLMGAKTIIMIAHRLSTVRKADTIFMLEKGKIIAQGSYDQLIKGSAAFRKLAKQK